MRDFTKALRGDSSRVSKISVSFAANRRKGRLHGDARRSWVSSKGGVL